MPVAAIALFAAATFGLRGAGPLLRDRLRLTPSVRALLDDGAAVLLLALAVTGAVTQGHGFAGWARVLGVAVGAVLAARRAPFPVVVVAAVGVTALLRLAGL